MTKKAAAIVVGVVLGGSAVFADISASEAKRLNEAATVLTELRAIPEKGIPEDTWNRAACVAVIPGVKKAAFMIGGEFGKGVMSCRSGQTWSAPIFLELEKGSAGFQIGAEQIDLVLLMMNRTGVDKLLGDKINLGADASAAEILAYSRAKGAFAGIDVSGGVLRPDKDANAGAYGASTTSRDVLFANSVKAPAAAQAFLRTLREETRATTGRKN